MPKTTEFILGVLFCTILGFAALLISPYIPIGSVTIAIILGILFGNVFQLAKVAPLGITFCEKSVLSVAITLMGTKLNYSLLQELGAKSIAIIIAAMVLTIFTAIILGRILKLNRNLSLLVGIGSGVCGSSAIAATERIIGADEEEVGISVAVVNVLGTLGIFLLPFIAKVLLRLP